MTTEEAIKIIDDECEHIKQHLTEKGKAEDFYIELGNMVIAFNIATKALKRETMSCYISIDDVMSVFDDFMCGEVDEDGTETFLEMLKDKAESEG